MPISPARAAAFEILMRVERDQAYASELLHSDRTSSLSPSDHGLATELVMGVLRWRGWLDERISGASSQKLHRLDLEVLTALRLGVYQLQFLSRVPARAAIFESVELVKAARKHSAASFVNAVLRKVDSGRAGDAFGAILAADDAKSLAATSAHPEWIVKRWLERYRLANTRQVCLHDQTVPSTAVSLDGGRTADELTSAGITLSPGLLLTSARRIQAGDVTKTQAYREGRVAIQDEASQLVALLVGRGEKILDCCAAPGGKAEVLARRNPRSQLFAAELHPHRARLLHKRVESANVRVFAADARHMPFQSGFDRILADVPCSGTGTLARNPEIKWRLTPEDLLDLRARQTAILKSALDCLVPGGRLLYSTCSLEREENEGVVEGVLAGLSGFTLIDCKTELERLQRDGELACSDPGSLLSGPYLRTIPGLHPCDGFFAAMIERASE